MSQLTIQVAVRMDPGSTAYLLDPSLAKAEEAFREVFPETSFEQAYAFHSWLAGTTIDLIITGLSVGAGIMAAEFLKECGGSLEGVQQAYSSRSDYPSCVSGR